MITQVSPLFGSFATSLTILTFRVSFIYIFHWRVNFFAFFSGNVLQIYRFTPKLPSKLSSSQFSWFGHIWVNNFYFGRDKAHSTFWIWIGTSSCNWFRLKRAISWYPNLRFILIKSLLGLLSQLDHSRALYWLPFQVYPIPPLFQDLYLIGLIRNCFTSFCLDFACKGLLNLSFSFFWGFISRNNLTWGVMFWHNTLWWHDNKALLVPKWIPQNTHPFPILLVCKSTLFKSIIGVPITILVKFFL